MQAERALHPTAADRAAQWLLRQWVWIIAGLLAIYAGLPWLSPLLRSLGFERAGRLIFRLYSAVCHQLPERSFFLGGYQVCYCHRCTALYSALLLLTLPMAIDGVWHLLDDLLPTLGLRSADSSVGSLNFWLRMITGSLFAAGVVLWSYPRLQRATQPIDPLRT